MDYARAEKIIDRLLNHNEVDIDSVDELISFFVKGYPIYAVEKLINSSNKYAYSSGLYIIEENPQLAIPIKDKILKLGISGNTYDKFVFIEFFLNTKLHEKRLVGIFAKLLNDFDLRIRAKAIVWLATTSEECFFLTKQISERKKTQENDGKFDEHCYIRTKRAIRIAEELRKISSRGNIKFHINKMLHSYANEDNLTFYILMKEEQMIADYIDGA
ncbi:hypothetical protein [Marinimicrococcus flavescens]|uniref:Uncharacterized protein n=1 Tax=Marinimicrococcus flavescens TaxID=3031815 RepID=A0AAP3V036_9PROT|nr:hypothetical protein [Marinimicrococcus flavescens]